MDGRESNGGLKNNSANGWTDGELNDQLENNSPNRWMGAELRDGPLLYIVGLPFLGLADNFF